MDKLDKRCSETDEKIFIEKTAIELFEEIAQCGYAEGYNSAEYDCSDVLC